eukprot:5786539-Pyramimonas_sp.AAC.1
MKLTQLFEIIEGTPPGIIHRIGIFNGQATLLELFQDPSPTWLLALQVGTTIFKMTSVDGMIYGCGIRQVRGTEEFTHEAIVAWMDNHWKDYYSNEINTSWPVNMAKIGQRLELVPFLPAGLQASKRIRKSRSMRSPRFERHAIH